MRPDDKEDGGQPPSEAIEDAPVSSKPAPSSPISSQESEEEGDDSRTQPKAKEQQVDTSVSDVLRWMTKYSTAPFKSREEKMKGWREVGGWIGKRYKEVTDLIEPLDELVKSGNLEQSHQDKVSATVKKLQDVVDNILTQHRLLLLSEDRERQRLLAAMASAFSAQPKGPQTAKSDDSIPVSQPQAKEKTTKSRKKRPASLKQVQVQTRSHLVAEDFSGTKESFEEPQERQRQQGQQGRPPTWKIDVSGRPDGSPTSIHSNFGDAAGAKALLGAESKSDGGSLRVPRPGASTISENSGQSNGLPFVNAPSEYGEDRLSSAALEAYQRQQEGNPFLTGEARPPPPTKRHPDAEGDTDDEDPRRWNDGWPQPPEYHSNLKAPDFPDAQGAPVDGSSDQHTLVGSEVLDEVKKLLTAEPVRPPRKRRMSDSDISPRTIAPRPHLGKRKWPLGSSGWGQKRIRAADNSPDWTTFGPDSVEAPSDSPYDPPGYIGGTPPGHRAVQSGFWNDLLQHGQAWYHLFWFLVTSGYMLFWFIFDVFFGPVQSICRRYGRNLEHPLPMPIIHHIPDEAGLRLAIYLMVIGGLLSLYSAISLQRERDTWLEVNGMTRVLFVDYLRGAGTWNWLSVFNNVGFEG